MIENSKVSFPLDREGGRKEGRERERVFKFRFHPQ
jgi:hypothetical protein